MTHLDKARDYIARGDSFYAKAAKEMAAARDEGVTWSAIARAVGKSIDWCEVLVSKHKSGEDLSTPWAADSSARTERAAKQVLRDPERAAELLRDDDARQNLGRALDQHYAKQITERKQKHEASEIERHGGIDEHESYLRRTRIAEVVNVARGLTTGMRFVVEEVKRLNLDEFEEQGSIEELVGCASEVEGFAGLLRQFLAGEAITDDAIAEWIGETR